MRTLFCLGARAHTHPASGGRKPAGVVCHATRRFSVSLRGDKTQDSFLFKHLSTLWTVELGKLGATISPQENLRAC